jgi:hypothetical protein
MRQTMTVLRLVATTAVVIQRPWFAPKIQEGWLVFLYRDMSLVVPVQVVTSTVQKVARNVHTTAHKLPVMRQSANVEPTHIGWLTEHTVHATKTSSGTAVPALIAQQ